jgi:hypothetical protein
VREFTLQIRLVDPFGKTLYVRATELPIEVCSDMEHAVGLMRLSHDLGVGSWGGLEETITLMRRRQFRRDEFIRYARRMGAQMADFMEDKEGWHGRDRAESAHEYLGKMDR